MRLRCNAVRPSSTPPAAPTTAVAVGTATFIAVSRADELPLELLACCLSPLRAAAFLALLAPLDLRLPPEDLEVAREELAPRDEVEPFDELDARDLLEVLREPDSLAPLAEDALRLLELAARPRVPPRALAELPEPFDFELADEERRPDEARFEPLREELR